MNRAESLLFVVGAPRSGTTWVQSLIAQHPKVVTTGESHLFSGYLEPWERRYRSERDRENPDIGLGILFDEDEMLAFYRDFAWKVVERIHSKDPAATLVMDKTPNHALCGTLIQQVFPSAMFLHVVRDPRSVASSMVAAGRGWGRHWAPTGIVKAVQEWCRYIAAAQALESRLAGSGRFLEVHYESLKEQRPSDLEAIFSAVGLETTQGECNRYFSACAFENQKLGNSPSPSGFHRTGQIDSWRRDLGRSEVRTVEHLALDQMERLGYQLSMPDVRRRPMRLAYRRVLTKIEAVARRNKERL